MWYLHYSEIVLICGVAADCCVLLTAFDAATRFGKTGVPTVRGGVCCGL